MLDGTLPFILPAAAVVLLSGFTQGLTSFGFALVAIPFLTGMMPLAAAVPLVVLTGMVANATIFAAERRALSFAGMVPLTAASVAAAPFGALILKRADERVLRVVVGLLITGFAAYLLRGKATPKKRGAAAAAAVGIASGLLNGSISMSGPPVALFFASGDAGKSAIRANFSLFSIVLNVATLVSFAAAGTMGASAALDGAVLAPVAAAGTALGMIAGKRLDDRTFRKLVLVIVALSGLWTTAAAAFRF